MVSKILFFIKKFWWILVVLISLLLILFVLLKRPEKKAKFGRIQPYFDCVGEFSDLVDIRDFSYLKTEYASTRFDTLKEIRVFRVDKEKVSWEPFVKRYNLVLKFRGREVEYYESGNRSIIGVLDKKNNYFSLTGAAVLLNAKPPRPKDLVLGDSPNSCTLKLGDKKTQCKDFNYAVKDARILLKDMHFLVEEKTLDRHKIEVNGYLLRFLYNDSSLYPFLPFKHALSLAINSGKNYWGCQMTLRNLNCKIEGCPTIDKMTLTKLPQLKPVALDLIYAHVSSKLEDNTEIDYLVPYYQVVLKGYDSKTGVSIDLYLYLPAYLITSKNN